MNLQSIQKLTYIVYTVHPLQLMGVTAEDVQEMLEEKQLKGSNEDWSRLIQKYSGNPLALKLVAEPINELFNGEIATFLSAGEGVSVFDDLYELLDQQFERLSSPEREVIYWLAISLEPISLDDLQDDVVSSLSIRELLETFNALLRRSMIQSIGSARFGLQPVIREYLTDRLVNEAYEEILSEELNILGSHALVQAQAKEYIRENQVRLFLMPLAKRLQTTLSRQGYSECLKELPAHKGRIWSVAFNPAGTLLVSGGEDGIAGVWEISSGKNMVRFSKHRNRIRSVSFKPYTLNQPCDTIASGSHDGTVKLWSLQTDASPQTLRSDRPYERMNITDITGVNAAQKAILWTLGAINNTQGGNVSS